MGPSSLAGLPPLPASAHIMLAVFVPTYSAYVVRPVTRQPSTRIAPPQCCRTPLPPAALSPASRRFGMAPATSDIDPVAPVLWEPTAAVFYSSFGGTVQVATPTLAVHLPTARGQTEPTVHMAETKCAQSGPSSSAPRGPSAASHLPLGQATAVALAQVTQQEQRSGGKRRRCGPESFGSSEAAACVEETNDGTLRWVRS